MVSGTHIICDVGVTAFYTNRYIMSSRVCTLVNASRYIGYSSCNIVQLKVSLSKIILNAYPPEHTQSLYVFYKLMFVMKSWHENPFPTGGAAKFRVSLNTMAAAWRHYDVIDRLYKTVTATRHCHFTILLTHTVLNDVLNLSLKNKVPIKILYKKYSLLPVLCKRTPASNAILIQNDYSSQKSQRFHLYINWTRPFDAVWLLNIRVKEVNKTLVS